MMKNLFIENSKMLMKEIGEYAKNWKDIAWS